MNERVLDTKSSLYDFIDAETTRIDIVASWENLCGTYDVLRFTDPITDTERLEEFKWIVHQMNMFLTRIRTKLLTCRDVEAMIDLLSRSYVPAGKMELNERRALAYQKLKQQWLSSIITRLTMMEEENDGRTNSETE